MHDSLSNGRRFRSLAIIDDFNREVLSIINDTSISAIRLVRELTNLCQWRGKPRKIRMDNGPEFISIALQQWAQEYEVNLCFIQPGKPTQNSYVERFHKTYRHEILNAYLFESMEQVRGLTQEWIWIYNHKRPHDSLGKLTPREFLLKYGQVDDFPTFQQDQHHQNLFSIFD